MEPLHWLAGLCSSDTALRGGLLLGLFAAGAAGSVIHCAPMCGVFVLGQMSERMARLPTARMCEGQRISNGLLLPYHLGRLTVYAGLGASAAGSAAVLGRVAWFTSLSAALLAIAAVLFLTHALGRILPVGVALRSRASRLGHADRHCHPADPAWLGVRRVPARRDARFSALRFSLRRDRRGRGLRKS